MRLFYCCQKLDLCQTINYSEAAPPRGKYDFIDKSSTKQTWKHSLNNMISTMFSLLMCERKINRLNNVLTVNVQNEILGSIHLFVYQQYKRTTKTVFVFCKYISFTFCFLAYLNNWVSYGEKHNRLLTKRSATIFLPIM